MPAYGRLGKLSDIGGVSNLGDGIVETSRIDVQEQWIVAERSGLRRFWAEYSGFCFEEIYKLLGV